MNKLLFLILDLNIYTPHLLASAQYDAAVALLASSRVTRLYAQYARPILLGGCPVPPLRLAPFTPNEPDIAPFSLTKW